MPALVVMVAGAAACGGSRAGLPGLAGRTLSAALRDAPGYLHADSSSVTFLQWQVGAGGTVQGRIDRATAAGAAPAETVTSSSDLFTGRISGAAVTFDMGSQTEHGTLSGSVLTLDVRQTDGTVEPVTFGRVPAAGYERALAALNTSVLRANAADQKQLRAQQDVTGLASDYGAVHADENSLRADLTTLTNDVSTAGGDLTTAQSDAQNVLTEARNGMGNATVCADAGSVATDADEVTADADSVSTDLDAVAGDLSGLRTLITRLGADLRQVESDQPGYGGRGATAPSPVAVQHAIGTSVHFVGELIQQVNSEIDQVNSDTAAGYQYAVHASSAGNCGLRLSAPVSITHIG